MSGNHISLYPLLGLSGEARRWSGWDRYTSYLTRRAAVAPVRVLPASTRSLVLYL